VFSGWLHEISAARPSTEMIRLMDFIINVFNGTIFSISSEAKDSNLIRKRVILPCVIDAVISSNIQ